MSLSEDTQKIVEEDDRHSAEVEHRSRHGKRDGGSSPSTMRLSDQMDPRHLNLLIDFRAHGRTGKTVDIWLPFGPVKSLSEVQHDALLRTLDLLECLLKRHDVKDIVLVDDEGLDKRKVLGNGGITVPKIPRDVSKKRATREFLRWVGTQEVFVVEQEPRKTSMCPLVRLQEPLGERRFFVLNNLLNGSVLDQSEEWYDRHPGLWERERYALRLAWKIEGGLETLSAILGEPLVTLKPYDPAPTGLTSLEVIRGISVFFDADSRHALLFRQYASGRVAVNILPEVADS